MDDVNPFSCSFCTNSFKDVKPLMIHLRCLHSLESSVKCQFKDCFREFPLKSFEKHLIWHKNQVCVDFPLPPKKPKPQCEPFQSLPSENSTPQDSTLTESIECNTNLNTGPENFNVNNVQFFNAISAAVTRTVANLYSKDTITRSHVQEIIEEMRDLFCGTFLDILETNVMHALQTAGSSDLGATRVMFDIMRGMFDDVSTERRRFNHLKSLDAYIEPSQYPVGTANVQESVNGQIIIQPVSLTGTIISPSKVLKSFLQLPGVFNEIINYMNSLERENDVMENMVQGTLWNDVIKPKFKDKIVLPLTMSFDDIATNKDLGSHATVHKLSACHVTISCLPPVFQSVLQNLFLVLLFHSADKDFGLEEVFRPLLEELKILENVGIEIQVNNATIRVYLALCLLIGDNLGLNTVLGFVQGFTANYFCRVCKCHKDTTAIQCYENPEFLRTQQNFDSDVKKNDQVSTGVKSKCLWNELSSFSNTVNLYVDIMHDIIEGVGNYDMAFIIHHYTCKKKKVSYSELNDLIQGFYYGNELGNKPPLVHDEKIRKEENLGFSASELLCLVRYFPLMVGHKIDEEDEVWQFYLCLREIVEMLFAPTFPRSSIPYLIDLIANHHKQYLKLTKKTLRPKFHHLVHYGRIIEKIGPLKPIWTMHSESKYKELRLAAHVISSRVKIDYTLSVKSSLKLCARFTMQKGLVHRFTFSPYVEDIPIEHIDGHFNFKHLVPPNETMWNVVNWVNVDGTVYKPDMVVIVSIGTYFPVFASIKTISVTDQQEARFLVQNLITHNFNSHLHSYCVTKDSSWLFISQKDLISFKPLNLRLFFDGRTYVMLRHAL